MFRTQSRPYGLCHHPKTKAHIKGFGSPLFACLCLLASILYACVSLSSSRLCHVWRPSRAWPCVVTSDAHEALFRCNHLGGISRFRVAPCVPFPFPLRTMLVCATRWLSIYLYTLAYMFMHKSCLLVCHPCFNTMKLWRFDPNLHLSLPWTPPFVCLLACLPSRLFACFLVSLLAMSIMLICFIPLSHTLYMFSFHCLSTGFLSLPMHVHTWSEDAWS